MGAMRLIANVIWFLLCGLWMAIGYTIAGIICCIPIATIPFAIASFRIAGYALWPFGRAVEHRPSAGLGSMLGNVIWFLLAGWWLAIAHVITAVAQCLTIIGIPLGIANLKLIPISLTPLGTRIVDTDRRLPARV